MRYVEKGTKITKTWTGRIYRINKKKKLVKVRRRAGKVQVRVIGHKNLKDSLRKPSIRKRRVKGFWNTSDSGTRQHRGRGHR